ncbi:flagellar hook-basal body complex protein FliE [Chromohalobacter canadensis]|uniref:Flagellar hook-basal body complex protein FliE n=1 Tax=Chromohalobacter canadensis TaxID=141389 RepID=A0A285VUT5_9GAMM|nr:flagellar hook-basal body complex protein FliE [Chromohalobacter canadensis]MCK0768705.1 flagellar hook-basal body complex protein FliE [Chromohalobacter canadensis]MCT8469778.1 flagellar hook-basal body complex protein FliE [Chromohalobacter canadensis]MCT8472387.1 flagellar hook-basal body complex protein FliE [Chromohalobacter canadensis]MCT8499500.1 flagellar hook-basal body complex protein FliE [Chromohalobacter canadensis]WQH09207.1 flagellar hook-basal body complex protein FliE [Chro
MSAPAISQALQQMQSLASQAGQTSGSQVSTAVGSGGFTGELHSAISRINSLKQNANAQAEAFEAGAPGVELNDVMVDMQKASIAFEMGTQVRNRFVTAYKDVMNMQV